MMKKRITRDDYLRANRKASREAEIENHGHPVGFQRIHVSKKVYNRKKMKAGDKSLPCFLYPERLSRIFFLAYALLTPNSLATLNIYSLASSGLLPITPSRMASFMAFLMSPIARQGGRLNVSMISSPLIGG